MDPQVRKSKKNIDNFIRYSNIAFEMAAIMGIGTLGGWAIDSWGNFKFPVFTLIFMILSVAGAIYHVIRKFL
jgi:ATP synthase protein I